MAKRFLESLDLYETKFRVTKDGSKTTYTRALVSLPSCSYLGPGSSYVGVIKLPMEFLE